MTVKNPLTKINPILILMLVLSTFLANPAPVSARPLAPPVQGLPVADLIKPDGSLNTSGAGGSINLAGWDVSLDPQRGPVFAPSTSGSTNKWSALESGTSSSVYAIAIDTDGNVYVGGSFGSVTGCTGGDSLCAYIAKWNGTVWSPLGTGVDNSVKAIAIRDTDVFVGGHFTGPCTGCNGIAKWSTLSSSWTKLGTSGTGGRVYAIAIDSSGNVYAGGNFTSVEGCSVTASTDCYRIAKWTSGSPGSWSALGKGLIANVYAIAVDSTGIVYVGGTFTICRLGPLDCNHIAKWTAADGWSELGGGADNDVSAIAISSSDEVYVGGAFASAGIVANTIRIAKWTTADGWSALGTGVNDSVNAIVISGSDVYVGGAFTSASSVANTKSIAKWNGTTWSALGKGTSSNVRAIAVSSSGTDVYAGGDFTSVGNDTVNDTPANYIAVYKPYSGTSTTISTSTPAEGSTLASSPSTLSVKFSADVVHDLSTNPKSATSLSNYMLVGTGLNSVFDTTVDSTAICSASHTPAGDDLKIEIASISYDDGTFTATLTIAPASLPLAAGSYRLYVCGKASINDMSGNPINDGANFPVNFSVTSSAAGAAAKFSKLPKTGFAPNRISVLPQQLESAAYTKMSGLWLEIPSQKMQANIVGVPLAYRNWDVTWLGQDAGWLNGTAYPTWVGNSVITAHVTNAKGLPGPFANLKNLSYGNKIVVHQFGEKYTFEVRDSRMVFPDTTGYAFEHLADKSYLTLITCQGYNFLTDSYMFRRVVRAVLVKVEAE